jgi:hypothetical protein
MSKDYSKMSDAELTAEYKRLNPVGYAEKSIFDNSPTKFSTIAKNTVESVAKGSAKGIVDLIGGWETLYNYLDAGNDPEAAKPKRILAAIKSITGVDLETSPYRTPYNLASAGAPAAATTVMGVPGLFNVGPKATAAQRAVAGAKEFGVAGSLGVAAPLVTESPLGQLAIQGTPYAAKGAFSAGVDRLRQPIGTFPPVDETRALLNVGPMTPGELTGNRKQLSREARVGASPEAENAPAFRQEQAKSVQTFLDNLFNRAASKTMNETELTKSVVSSFDNYGKALSGRLQSDAMKDFNAAKKAGGTVDTQPVLDAVNRNLASLPPETPGLDNLKASVKRIVDQYAIPEVLPTSTPSAIIGPNGQPVAVTTTPGSPAAANRIDIDRLQKNLSAWGSAVYSGTADFGKGNIFEGVAPGQAKGLARTVLGGFRDALNQAIDQGVPGADQLKKARDKFSSNLDAVDEFANRPLVKSFDVGSPSELVPETVLQKLKDAPPSQRAILIDILQNNPQASEILDTIRRSTFNDVIQKARVPNAPTNAPDFSVSAALAELNKPQNELSFLFKDKADLDQAKLVMNYMQRVLQGENVGSAGIGGSAAYAGTKAMGGNTQQANMAKESFSAIKDFVNSPAAFSEILFNPESKQALIGLATNKSIGQKGLDALITVGKVGGTAALRGAPMLSIEKAPDATPTEPQTGTVDVKSLSDEQLIQLYQQQNPNYTPEPVQQNPIFQQ